MNNFDQSCDAIIVDRDHDDSAHTGSAQAKIILHTTSTSDDCSQQTDGKQPIFNLGLPFNSLNIINTLNKISKLMVNNDLRQNQTNHSSSFSLKKTFSRFLRRGETVEKPVANAAQKARTPVRNGQPVVAQKAKSNMVNNLFKLLQPNQMQQLKVVFLGAPGSGKTTAIAEASSGNTLTTEVKASDTVGLLKSHTTIGIDFGPYH